MGVRLFSAEVDSRVVVSFTLPLPLEFAFAFAFDVEDDLPRGTVAPLVLDLVGCKLYAC